MIIDSSKTGMESVRKYTSVRRDAYGISSFTDFSGRFKKPGKAQEGSGVTGPTASAEDPFSRIRRKCINYLIYLLFGKRMDEEDYTLSSVNASSSPYKSADGFLVRNSFEEHYFYEEEQTSFRAQGSVCTADGREISFGLDFSMSRSFEEYYKIEATAIEARMCDPLVINLDTDTASVSDQRIMFDLDADEKMDSIPGLGSKSAFLSLDRNEDGIINNGSELFGTSSGNGFRDLSVYDSDGNGWIDEADEVFDRLTLCVFDENGEQKLYKLKEKGLGAIFLGSVDTEFLLRDHADNRINAAIRKTGIFLYENGTAGTVQHLDLAQ